MIKWIRVEDCLYQKYVDGVPKNAYIDRISTESEKGNRHVIAWQFIYRFGDAFETCGYYCNTLRRAKGRFADWEGDE